MHQALGMMEASRTGGMVTMDRALRDLYNQDLISQEEALRYARTPKMVVPQTVNSSVSKPLPKKEEKEVKSSTTKKKGFWSR